MGRPDAHAGELPMAFVQLRPSAQATPAELLQFARERVSERAAAPAEIIVLDQLPLTGVGKIFKPALRHVAAAQTLERALQALEAGQATFIVDVGPHPVHGALASVRICGALSPDEERSVRRLLDKYRIQYEIVVSG